MRSILEKAFVALLNEEHDKAEELFHKFIVERARQIHESNRAGEDFVLEENWDDEITTESYFTEEDLADLEDGSEDEGEEGAEGGEDFGGEEGAADFGGDEAGEGEDFGGDEAGDDFGGEEGDLGGEEGGEEALEDKIDDLEDQIEKLTAEFEAMMDALGDGDADAEGGDDFGGDEGGEGDLGGDDLGGDDFGGEEGGEELAGGLEDDMEDEDAAHMESLEEGEDEEEELEEEFDDITESIIDELEKVTVTLDDGKEVGTGSGITQNKSAAIPQKGKDARQGGEPIKMKVKNHKGFEREAAPAVADMKARRNTKKTADAGQSKVSKEGDKSAEINKLNSDGNNKSLL